MLLGSECKVVDDRHGRHFRCSIFDVREETSEQSVRVCGGHQLAPTQFALGESEEELGNALLDGRGARHACVEKLTQLVTNVVEVEELKLVFICNTKPKVPQIRGVIQQLLVSDSDLPLPRHAHFIVSIVASHRSSSSRARLRGHALKHLHQKNP